MGGVRQVTCEGKGGTPRDQTCAEVDTTLQYYMNVTTCADVQRIDPWYSAHMKMTLGPACCTDGVSICGAHTPVMCADPSAFNGEVVYGFECELNTEAACTAAGGRWELNDDKTELECNEVPDSVQNDKVGCGTCTGILLGATVWFDSACTCGSRH